MPPGAGEVVHALRLIDAVAEQHAAFGAQSQQFARESAPVTWPAASVTPRWRTLSRFIRLMAR